MNETDRTQTEARAINRNIYQVSHDTSESNETANHCTMFIIGATAFLAGFWGLVCLVSAVLHEGPMMMLKNLATAVTGF